MGTVFRARRRVTGQVVALKVMTTETASNPVLLKRFQQEFAAASRLRYPHIVQGLDFGVEAGRPYLVMEFVEGQNLVQRVREQGPLPQAEALRVILQVASGLQLAHENKLIHRDVKPDNILLQDGQAKLTDLGAPTDLTRSRTCLGTIAFIAPEQFEDAKRVDVRCDVYGLGASLYYALTGALPFQGAGNLSILRKKLRNEYTPPSRRVPSLPPFLDAAICKALDATPAKRHASCAEFSDSLTGTGAAADPGPEKSADMVAGVAPLPDPEERRAALRYPSTLHASCRPVQEQKRQWPAEVQDVSLTGIRLCLNRRFELGAVLAVEVHDQQAATVSLLFVKVRWVREVGPRKWGIGCAFDRKLHDDELCELLESKPHTVVIHES
jgi:serine/threonine protein kinase